MARDGSSHDPPNLDLMKTLGATLTDIELPDVGESRRGGHLIVIAGAPADLGINVVVGRSARIGRDVGELRLRDGRVSRVHVRVWLDQGSYYVEDLGSSNGSRLNGRMIERPTPIGEGDKIYLGNTVIKFTLVDETEAAYLARMEQMAGSDPLTGLHAKHRFDSILDEHLASDRRPVCVMMMDLDGLKAINDAHGHRMGAHTIAMVGKTIGDVIGTKGEACRFGGDEFCAYVSSLSMREALGLAEEVRRLVEEATFAVDGAFTRATISIGCARRGSGVDTRAQLISLADQALYRAKNAGRNRVSE